MTEEPHNPQCKRRAFSDIRCIFVLQYITHICLFVMKYLTKITGTASMPTAQSNTLDVRRNKVWIIWNCLKMCDR